jgi:hypothetical protein
MAYDIALILSLAGGATGWSLFGYAVITTYCSRTKEIKMIQNLSEEIKEIKKDIKELK